MAMTCNFDKDGQDEKKSDRIIVRIDPGQNIGEDSPRLKPAKGSAYLWVMNHRRRCGKNWRATGALN